MKKIIASLFALCFLEIAIAQQHPHSPSASCGLRISLLTCSAGQELYTTWGHSALRILDSSTHTDLVYNYGTFDFDDPDFYSKFIRGKLLYFVSVDTIDNFLYEYRYYHRGVTEQVLDLSCAEKNKLLGALQENIKDENKYYRYDFIYDNCTTRLRDMVFKNVAAPAVTASIIPRKGTTFRNLIHVYLDSSRQYWSKLGIDILLGSPLDKRISNSEAMFLPYNLSNAFDHTSILGKPIVMEKKDILKAAPQPIERTSFSPLLVFSIFFLLVAAASFSTRMKKVMGVLDFFLFFLMGALGILLLFMWFGTDHPECRSNFNLLWAFPLHFVFTFFIYKQKRWVKYYFLGNSMLLLLLLLAWKWLPQEMNNALIPIICVVLLRSVVRYQNLVYAL